MTSLGVGEGIERAAGAGDQAHGPAPAPLGPTLAIAVTLAFGWFLVAMALVLLVVHPGGSGVVANVVIGQNQSAKTALYLAAFAVILPLALIAGRRLAATITSGCNAAALPVLSALLAASLAAVIILLRLSSGLPWGDGIGVVLAGAGVWSLLAIAALRRAAAKRPWAPLLRLDRFTFGASVLAGALVIGTLLGLTHLGGLSALALVLGLIAMGALLAAGYGRLRVRAVAGTPGLALDAVIVLVLLLAIPDVVVFTSSSAVPNVYFEPGVIQFQQDWILGPANQLLHGGALLVNDPSSQYGVGLVYFLAGWFHLAPIGYATFGLLDGILTALLYLAGYAVLRIAGVTRLLAASVLAFGVVTFVYALHFNVGALPEQGPLRFGLPILVVLALTAAARSSRRERGARIAALAVVGLSSIWAIEAFAYTTFTFAAVAAVEARVRAPDDRARWFVRRLALAAVACLCAHLVLALATLAGTGHLPDWGQYLAYVHGLLLGGREGSITFGFERWSPALALGGLCLASAAAIALLVLERHGLARRERTTMIALTGSTAYAIASLSYTDNRSSTYLLLYVAPPALIAAALWLSLLLRVGADAQPRRVRLSALAFASAVAVLMLAAAWPAVGAHFDRSALAHAYPGGGLRAALHRLWHPPPIDPRAPAGERLVTAYLPGSHVLVLLPTTPDLAIEILMRARRANALFIGDPSGDTFIPSVWMPRVQRQIDQLRPGTRVLTSEDALRIVAQLRGHPAAYAFAHSIAGGATQLQWVLHQIDQRFSLRPVVQGPSRYVVAELVARRR